MHFGKCHFCVLLNMQVCIKNDCKTSAFIFEQTAHNINSHQNSDISTFSFAMSTLTLFHKFFLYVFVFCLNSYMSTFEKGNCSGVNRFLHTEKTNKAIDCALVDPCSNFLEKAKSNVDSNTLL